MELNEQLIETIIMSATAGQFGTQIIEETFKLSIEKLDAAKKELTLHLLSGAVSFSAYFFTNESFVAKAAALAFLSGVFAEAALKLLKKKNESATDKTTELAIKLEQKEREELEDKVKFLEEKISKLQESKNV
jgi:uncharacterized protein YlxW (UPF0749 family)